METDELIDAICALLPRGHGRGGRRRGEDGASAGAALELLRCAGETSPGELARALHVSGPRVTALLDELERRGLVSRSTDAGDRRCRRAALTPEGSRFLAEKRAARRAHVAAVVEAVGRADAEAWLRILRAERALEEQAERT